MNDKRICIYSAVFGGYEYISNPVPIDGVDYIMFTDNPDIKSSVWDIRYTERPVNIPPVIFYKQFKCLPHKYLDEYDYCIWIDGNFEVKHVDFVKYMLSKFKSESLLLYRHYSLSGPHRRCIGKEVYASIKSPKYRLEPLIPQVKSYIAEGFPKDFGLYMSGVIMFNIKDAKVIEFCELWHSEIIKHAVAVPQCQISLPYVLWKTEIQFDINSDCIYDLRFYNIFHHKIAYDGKGNPLKTLKVLKQSMIG